MLHKRNAHRLHSPRIESADVTVYVEIFDRARGILHPEMVHSEPVTSSALEAEVFDDLRKALADGSLSGNELAMYLIDHDEPCECVAAIIAPSCTILRKVALSNSVPA